MPDSKLVPSSGVLLGYELLVPSALVAGFPTSAAFFSLVGFCLAGVGGSAALLLPTPGSSHTAAT